MKEQVHSSVQTCVISWGDFYILENHLWYWPAYCHDVTATQINSECQPIKKCWNSWTFCQEFKVYYGIRVKYFSWNFKINIPSCHLTFLSREDARGPIPRVYQYDSAALGGNHGDIPGPQDLLKEGSISPSGEANSLIKCQTKILTSLWCRLWALY